MYFNKSNKEILAELDKHVIGHEQAKKMLISLVNRSKMAYYHKYLDETYNDTIEPMNMLLVGASGTGKTHLVQSLKKLVDFPLVIIDAGQLEPTGGSKAQDSKYIMQQVVENAKRLVLEGLHTGKAKYHSVEGTVDQTIVFIDECDKLAKAFEASGNWNRQIQYSLLTLLENQEELKHVSFVLAGAFTDLRKDRAPKRSIGFNSKELSEEVQPITDADIIKYGLVTELVGRISSIVELEVLDEEKLTTILETILIPQSLRNLAFLGINGEDALTSDVKESIVKIAVESGQGVRSMKRSLNLILNDLEFNYEENQINMEVVK